MGTHWLDIEDFTDVIYKHDVFAADGNFDNWYKLFSKYASELADYFLVSFASVRDGVPTREQLITAFQSVSQADFEATYKKHGSRAFHPWFNWYYGYWDNGTSRTANYHIWDNTVAIAGRYMQPVTQSTTDFAYNKDKSGRRVSLLNDMEKRRKTDLGVDFLSPSHGITGWVSKPQQNPTKEMAHIGYLIGEKILIWIARYLGEEASNEWHLFYERGNRTYRASLYSVDGVKVKITDSGGVSAGDKGGKGKVEYFCQLPYSLDCQAELHSLCDEY